MTSSDKFRDLLAQRPEGSWILLSDACVDPRTGSVGLGGALFDPRGQAVSTWSERAPMSTRDTTVAELMALDLGARRAKAAGAERLFAVADCQPSVMALNGNDAACSKAQDLVREVRATFAGLSAWACAWSPRHRLSVPNDLARAALGKAPENRQAVGVQDLTGWLQPVVVDERTVLEREAGRPGVGHRRSPR